MTLQDGCGSTLDAMAIIARSHSTFLGIARKASPLSTDLPPVSQAGQLTDSGDFGLGIYLALIGITLINGGTIVFPRTREPSLSTALAIFAKRPVPGQVKTRLTPALSPEAAAGLYWAMVEDTWARASELPNVDLHLFVDQPWEGFDALANGRPVLLQTGDDLGTRMLFCLQLLTTAYLNPTIIIGSDSPTLPAGHIQGAFALLQNDDNAVLGPAEDGGYYLVGCRRTHPEMFRGVAWSADQTLAQTRAAFAAQGYQTHLTPMWRDVDVIEDVRRLAKEPVGPSVQAWLRQNPL